jgi:hypothetical protein
MRFVPMAGRRPLLNEEVDGDNAILESGCGQRRDEA